MSDNDLIRRSDALKAMAKAIGHIVYDAEAVSQHVMNSIPAVEPKQAWIPCEERLPEDKCDVLIQFGWNMAVGCIDGGDWRINCGDAWCTDVAEDDGKPVAWMPLPEPRKGADDHQI